MREWENERMNCGNCYISLACHVGLINYMYVCPLCGYLVVHQSKGSELINCTVRCNTNSYKVWLARFNEFYTIGETYLCTVLQEALKDPGPIQEKYRNSNANSRAQSSTLIVQLCNTCYGILCKIPIDECAYIVNKKIKEHCNEM